MTASSSSRRDRRARLSWWGPPVLWMAAIFSASSIPNLTRIPGGLSDATAHAGAYAVLALLLLRALARGNRSGIGARSVMLAVTLSIAYGVTDEWHQRFVEGRTWSLSDLAADAGGALTAAVLAWAWALASDRRPRTNSTSSRSICR